MFITEIMSANIDLVFCSQSLLVEGSHSPQTFPLISVWWHETDNWRPQGFVDIHISTEMENLEEKNQISLSVSVLIISFQVHLDKRAPQK